MRKAIVLLVLVFLISTFSGCGNDQYAKERKYWYIKREADKIFQNPHAVPVWELEGVIGKLRNFVKENPDTAMALEQEFVIGRLYGIKERYDEAEAEFNKIIDKYADKPNVCAEAMFLIGKVYEVQERWDLALKEYKKIMNEYPITGKGLDMPFYIAKHYEENHEPEKMVAAYKQAIAYFDSLALTHPSTRFGYIVSILKAQCYIELKDWESAIGAYNEIIGKYREREIVLDQPLMSIAMIYYKQLNNPSRAKLTLEKLVKDYPESRFINTAKKILEEIGESNQ